MVAQRQVAVVVDSSACLPTSLVEQWQIKVVPQTLIIDGAVLRDGVDIKAAEFYQLLRQGYKSVTTSAPNPRAFQEAFTSSHTIAPDVLCIVVASRLSAAYAAAQVARTNACRAIPGLRVHILDSRTAAGACALLTLKAAQEAFWGLSLDTIVKRAKQTIPQLRLLATLSDLGYLRASGRVGWLATSAASALRINPVFELREGEPSVLAKPRSRARAIAQIVEQMRKTVGNGPVDVNIMEADTASEAEALRQTIEAQFNCRELFISQMTPVIGAHTGPGVLGVAFRVAGNTASEGSPD